MHKLRTVYKLPDSSKGDRELKETTLKDIGIVEIKSYKLLLKKKNSYESLARYERKKIPWILFIAICLKCYFLLIESLASSNRLQKHTSAKVIEKNANYNLRDCNWNHIPNLNEWAIRLANENMLK